MKYSYCFINYVVFDLSLRNFFELAFPNNKEILQRFSKNSHWRSPGILPRI